MMKTIATKNGGVQVELTPEEEQAVLSEWSANESKRVQEEQEKAAKEQMKINLKNDLKVKLSLSDEEVEILLGDAK